MDFLEREVTIESTFTLKGTLSIPNSNREVYPGVLILCGSGELDRNCYMKSSQEEYITNLNSYKLLSDFFNELGFATLRYDKRGVGQSDGDFFETGYYDLLNDAEIAFKFFKNQKEIDENDIVIVGHSEGGMMINMLMDSINIKRAILLAGAGTCAKSCWKHTFMMYKKELERESKCIKKVYINIFGNLHVKRFEYKEEKFFLNTKENYVIRKGKKREAKWYREHYKLYDDDYLNILKNTQTKVLAITGNKDIQVNPKDLDRIDTLGNKNIKTIRIENMNHQLRYFDDDITVARIRKQWKDDAKKPLHPKLLEEIRKWIITA